MTEDNEQQMELTFQLQATDVFRTARNSVFAYGTSMLLDKWNYSDSQAVKLTVSYRFNSVKQRLANE